MVEEGVEKVQKNCPHGLWMTPNDRHEIIEIYQIFQKTTNIYKIYKVKQNFHSPGPVNFMNILLLQP